MKISRTTIEAVSEEGIDFVKLSNKKKVAMLKEEIQEELNRIEFRENTDVIEKLSNIRHYVSALAEGNFEDVYNYEDSECIPTKESDFILI